MTKFRFAGFEKTKPNKANYRLPFRSMECRKEKNRLHQLPAKWKRRLTGISNRTKSTKIKRANSSLEDELYASTHKVYVMVYGSWLIVDSKDNERNLKKQACPERSRMEPIYAGPNWRKILFERTL